MKFANEVTGRAISHIEKKAFALLLAVAVLAGTSSIVVPMRANAAEGNFGQDFSLEANAWGEAYDEDVSAVLKSVMAVYESFFGKGFVYDPKAERTQIVYKAGDNSPFTALDNSVIRLDCKDRLWAKFMYQFSHEVYHYVTNHQSNYIYAEKGISKHAWFEEAICEAMSVIVLKRSAVDWKTAPPYANWADYAGALDEYATDTMAGDLLQYDQHRYANLHSAIVKELPNLAADSDYPNNERHVQNRISAHIFEYYEKYGFSNIAAALKTLMPMTSKYENVSFDGYIQKWYALSSSDGRKFVRYIADKMSMDAPSNWAAAAVKSANDIGLTVESLNTAYQTVTTRAEFCRLAVTFLRLYGYDVDSVKPKLFSDTSDRDIGIAAALAITSGTSVERNTFSPNNPLTREQAATMLRNVLNVIGMSAPVTNVAWADAKDISSWARDAADVMYNTKIMGGTSSTALVFSPKANYTHEQALVAVMNLWTYAEKTAFAPNARCSDQLNSEEVYAMLTNGVTHYKSDLLMSQITILNSNTVFPLLVSGSGKSDAVSLLTSNGYISGISNTGNVGAVFGSYAEGRFVAFQHDGNWTNELQEDTGVPRLRNNVLEWLGNGYKNKKVGFITGHGETAALNPDKLAASAKSFLNAKGVAISHVRPTDDLSSYDVLVLSGTDVFSTADNSYSEKEKSNILNYVSGGGGLLCVALGWAWENYGVGSELPQNAIVEKLGFRFDSGVFTGNFMVDAKNPPQSAVPIIHSAKSKTDGELKAALSARKDSPNLVEGEYVVLHLPNEAWAKIDKPKVLIDRFDSAYSSELQLLGGKAAIYKNSYGNKLICITDYSAQYYMYMLPSHCAMSYDGAIAIANDFVKSTLSDASWGAFHETGHAMVNNGCGGLFNFAASSESWNNVLNIYAHKNEGLYEQARKQAYQYPQDYVGSNGVDYDLLSDDRRQSKILADKPWVFVKLPLMLIDYYGWDGMQAFFTKAAKDAAAGVAIANDQDKIDYAVIGLSSAYGMDLSSLFDYWKLPATQAAKAKLSSLPKEKMLSELYGTTKMFVKYLQYK